ncbi:MAG: hypothetical protein Q4G09_03205 [Clostridia bacterium]|nr:hypothetical protein [Clostridia bacterium]
MNNDELKFRINDLLKEWILFRDEALATLTKEDKKHPLRFEEFEDKLIKSLPYKNREYARIVTAKMYDDFLDFSNYYSEKYYRAGFGDCLNLVIMSLGGASK